MTSLCKNASGWLLSRAPGKGREKGFGPCHPLAAPASSTFMHLRTALDKLLSCPELRFSHVYRERPSGSESRRPHDSSRLSLRGPLGCRYTKGSPGTGGPGFGAGRRGKWPPAQLRHTETTKVLENKTVLLEGWSRVPPINPFSLLVWSW